MGGILERDEIDEPDTVGEGRLEAPGHRDCEAGLADPARPKQRQEARRILEEMATEYFQLMIPIDQGCWSG